MRTKIGSKTPQDYTPLEISADFEKKGWEPWTKAGPMLRVDSFTAGQMACSQPQAMHLESRTEFIGDFPPNWIANNCAAWSQAVSNYMEIARRDSDTAQKPTRRNVNRQRRLVDLNLAERIASETESSIRDNSSKRERLRKEMRRRRNRFRRDQSEVIAQQQKQSSDESFQNSDFKETLTNSDTPRESDIDESKNALTRSVTASSEESSSSDDWASFKTAREPDDSDTFELPAPADTNAPIESSNNNGLSNGELPRGDTLKDNRSIEQKLAAHSTRRDHRRLNLTKLSSGLHRSKLASTEPEDPQNLKATDIEIAQDFDNSDDNHSVDSSTLFYDAGVADSEQAQPLSGNPYRYPESPKNPGSIHASSRTLNSEKNATLKGSKIGVRKYGRKVEKHFEKTNKKQASSKETTPESFNIINQQTDYADAPESVDEDRHVKVVSPTLSPSTGMDKNHSNDHLSFTTSTKSNKSRWHHIPFTKVISHGPKIYQGRFSVQERRSRALCPVVNEFDAPLSTQSVTRWKECAVHARRNEDPQRPSTLYFYKSTNMRRHPWNSQSNGQLTSRDSNKKRGLEYKVKLDRNYRIAFFSPLDSTLAIWRPRTKIPRHRRYYRPHTRVGNHIKHHHQRTKGYNGNNTPYYTQVLIIHAQSVTAIMDLAYLIAAATSSAPLSYGPSTCTIDIPSINVKAQINTNRERPDFQQINDISFPKRQELVAYSELLLPAASISPSGRRVMAGAWHMIDRLPRRFAVSRPNENSKFALAWVMDDIARRPLWMPSATSTMHPVNRSNFLVYGKARLVIAQPMPKCYLGDKVEPAPVEGYCNSADVVVTVSIQKRLSYQAANYSFTSDCYLMFLPANQGEPPMLASSQNDIVKKSEPFALDESGEHISWIIKSTCLAEVDRRNAMAKVESDRKTRLIARASGFSNSSHYNTFDIVNETDLESSSDDHPTRFRISFIDKKIAELWCEKLREIAQFWQDKFQAWAIKRMAGVEYCNYTITSFLHNRPIVYNGPLFMKEHRFATFKSFHVILTATELVVFRTGKALRAPAHPQQTIPAASLNHHRVTNFDLRFTYIYSGQAASHVLSDNDSHIDPANPGFRALPRSYEHGWISADTELDRCFVLWRARESRLSGLSSSRHKFIAFLAPEKNARDEWVTAIRNVQTQLQSVSTEEDEDAVLHQEDEEDEDY